MDMTNPYLSSIPDPLGHPVHPDRILTDGYRPAHAEHSFELLEDDLQNALGVLQRIREARDQIELELLQARAEIADLEAALNDALA